MVAQVSVRLAIVGCKLDVLQVELLLLNFEELVFPNLEFEGRVSNLVHAQKELIDLIEIDLLCNRVLHVVPRSSYY